MGGDEAIKKKIKWMITYGFLSTYIFVIASDLVP